MSPTPFLPPLPLCFDEGTFTLVASSSYRFVPRRCFGASPAFFVPALRFFCFFPLVVSRRESDPFALKCSFSAFDRAVDMPAAALNMDGSEGFVCDDGLLLLLVVLLRSAAGGSHVQI